jgi:succinoglycan biosynthesis protein ExoU
LTVPRLTDTAIIIAAYNSEATLDRAVGSALAQPEAAEICVVDDCSTDGTLTLAQAWTKRDARVTLLANPANGGPAAARNRAIATTTAPWLTVLDADDYLLDGRLGKMLAEAGDADFVADALMRTVEGGAPTPTVKRFKPETLNLEAFLLGNLSVPNGALDLGFLKPLFARAFLDRHDLRYNERLRLGEDYEFYGRALALGARFLVGGPAGYVSVEREGSLSKHHSEDDLERLRDCDNAIGALGTLSRAELRALRRHWGSVDCRLQWRRLISAVKARDLRTAIATFHTPTATVYLTARLAEQAALRAGAALRRGPGLP